MNPESLEIIPAEEALAKPVFSNIDEYIEFREEFASEVAPQQDQWREARRQSEEEARERLLYRH